MSVNSFMYFFAYYVRQLAVYGEINITDAFQILLITEKLQDTQWRS
jgi:hypothetical protein